MNRALKPTTTMSPIVQQAASDEQLIALWIHGRSEHTQSL